MWTSPSSAVFIAILLPATPLLQWNKSQRRSAISPFGEVLQQGRSSCHYTQLWIYSTRIINPSHASIIKHRERNDDSVCSAQTLQNACKKNYKNINTGNQNNASSSHKSNSTSLYTVNTSGHFYRLLCRSNKINEIAQQAKQTTFYYVDSISHPFLIVSSMAHSWNTWPVYTDLKYA